LRGKKDAVQREAMGVLSAGCWLAGKHPSSKGEKGQDRGRGRVFPKKKLTEEVSGAL